MIFRNYNRKNYFKNLIDSFSKDTAQFGFGVVKSYTAIRYKWVANFLFKHKNNTATNTHKAYVAFYNNNDIMNNEYGNVKTIVDHFPSSLSGTVRTKFPIVYHEFTSRQYSDVSQEYVGSDYIEFLKLSNKLYSSAGEDAILGDGVDGDRHIHIFHQQGDTPAFVASGYVYYDAGSANPVYIFDNQPNAVEIIMNSVKITTNDYPADVYTSDEFLRLVALQSPIDSGSIS